MSAPILRRILSSRKRPIALWVLALAGVSAMYTSVFPWMEKMDLDDMLQAFPPEFMEIMGYDDIGTASGYIGSAVYGLIAFALLLVFAIGNAGRLIAGQEEDGALELELTSPVSRRTIYTERAAALWCQTTLLVVGLFVATFGVSLALGMDVPVVDLLGATLGLWLVGGLFGTITFAVGAATGRRVVALGTGAGLAVVGWMLNAIGPTIDMDWMGTVSPVGWYMAENPMNSDFSVVNTLLLVAGSAIAFVLGWVRFRSRDLMT